MPKAPKYSPVMVRVSLAERAALEQIAASECRSLSQMARLLLVKSLPETAVKTTARDKQRRAGAAPAH